MLRQPRRYRLILLYITLLLAFHVVLDTFVSSYHHNLPTLIRLTSRADPPLDWGGSTSDVSMDSSDDGEVEYESDSVASSEAHMVQIPTFDEAWAKGCTIWSYVTATIPEATAMFLNTGMIPRGTSSESEYMDFGALATWGWDAVEPPDLDWAGDIPIVPALTGLGLGTAEMSQGGPWNYRSWQQNRDVTVGGVYYQHSTGDFSNVYNIFDGAIVAHYNYGPYYKALEEYGSAAVKQMNIVPLKHWSDVAFLTYAHLCSTSTPPQPVAALRYIFKIGIANTASSGIIEHVLGRRSLTEPPPWPGITYTMDMPEAMALLSTPAGLGTAMFILQHKEALALKTIAKIQLFGQCAAVPSNFCMLFTLGDPSPGSPSRARKRKGARL